MYSVFDLDQKHLLDFEIVMLYILLATVNWNTFHVPITFQDYDYKIEDFPSPRRLWNILMHGCSKLL